jgi:hypothetical protein
MNQPGYRRAQCCVFCWFYHRTSFPPTHETEHFCSYVEGKQAISVLEMTEIKPFRVCDLFYGGPDGT